MIVGKHTYGSHYIQERFSDSGATLRIGAFCSIASNIVVFLGGTHRTDLTTTFPFGSVSRDVFTTVYSPSKRPNYDVTIGNDVWIGERVVIMQGRTVGDGAVIACNSHVVKDVEPYTVVGGNPAQFLKYRFDPSLIERMLKIKWWDWDDEVINQRTDFMFRGSVEEFIIRAENNNWS
jgi:acetyltransferase-like isoleucine patch superfamily enzyme